MKNRFKQFSKKSYQKVFLFFKKKGPFKSSRNIHKYPSFHLFFQKLPEGRAFPPEIFIDMREFEYKVRANYSVMPLNILRTDRARERERERVCLQAETTIWSDRQIRSAQIVASSMQLGACAGGKVVHFFKPLCIDNS